MKRTSEEINAHLAFAKRYRDQLNNEIVQLEDAIKSRQPDPIKITVAKPMKSAEEWACYYLGLDEPPSNKGMGFLTIESFVKRIQADAAASKLPQVDLLGLADETLKSIKHEMFVNLEVGAEFLLSHIIHAALLKARGEK